MNDEHHQRALLRAFGAQLGPLDRVEARRRPWASATFAGTRHTISFDVGHDVDLELFAQTIAEADIELRRAFVADVAVVSVTPATDPMRRVVVEALVVDDA